MVRQDRQEQPAKKSQAPTSPADKKIKFSEKLWIAGNGLLDT